MRCFLPVTTALLLAVEDAKLDAATLPMRLARPLAQQVRLGQRSLHRMQGPSRNVQRSAGWRNGAAVTGAVLLGTGVAGAYNAEVADGLSEPGTPGLEAMAFQGYPEGLFAIPVEHDGEHTEMEAESPGTLASATSGVGWNYTFQNLDWNTFPASMDDFPVVEGSSHSGFSTSPSTAEVLAEAVGEAVQRHEDLSDGEARKIERYALGRLQLAARFRAVHQMVDTSCISRVLEADKQGTWDSEAAEALLGKAGVARHGRVD